jgi:hypothetical protein
MGPFRASLLGKDLKEKEVLILYLEKRHVYLN